MLTGALGALRALPLAYIIFNVDPILFKLGPFSVHWYGLAYVVAISVGLWFILRWARREGFHDDQVWSLFVWAAIAGLIGGRLYFVIQQPDLVEHYLLQPLNIIAVWNGGMAFFGAIFLGTATVFALAPRYGLDRFIVMDGGAFFAAIGQIFGRFGNVVNGDIVGLPAAGASFSVPAGICAHAPCISYVSDPHVLPWAIVYTNLNNTFVPLGVPFHPAPIYEMLANLVALAILWPLRHKLPRIRAGLFFLLYLALYAIGQFVVFFARNSEPTTPFLGISGLKQAQWTAIFVLLACIPLYYLIRRFSGPWPYSDKRPVAWPPNAAGVAASAVAVAGGASAAPARRRGAGVRRAPAPPSSEPVIELPPWEPYRPRPGELRNRFVPRP